MLTSNRSIVLAGACAMALASPFTAEFAIAAAAAPPRILAPLHVDIGRFSEVGRAEFGTGANSVETVQGFAGQGFETLILMPEDNVALCSGLTLHYASGETEAYPLIGPGLLNQTQIYQIAPRGNPGDVVSIDADCRGASGDGVRIAFYGLAGPVFERAEHAPAATHNEAPPGED